MQIWYKRRPWPQGVIWMVTTRYRWRLMDNASIPLDKVPLVIHCVSLTHCTTIPEYHKINLCKFSSNVPTKIIRHNWRGILYSITGTRNFLQWFLLILLICSFHVGRTDDYHAILHICDYSYIQPDLFVTHLPPNTFKDTAYLAQNCK